MNRVKATVAYDGTNFAGYQSQPGGVRTVQSEIDKALVKIHKDKGYTRLQAVERMLAYTQMGKSFTLIHR